MTELFKAASVCGPESRAAFLVDACAGDDEMRRELEEMLAAHERAEADGFLEKSLSDIAADVFEQEDAAQTETGLGSLLGPYRIEKLLGAGGMAQVFQAVDTRLGRRVAVKVSAEKFSKRFKREARAISVLNHPNICTLYDVGPNYLVMELIEGETLRDWFQRALPLEHGLEIARQLLDGLGAAHRAGLVHRDLKPENVMIRSDGRVKVLDFGLAKWLPGKDHSPKDSIASLNASLTGQMVGTVAYMSPEQIQGEGTDPRTDLFALGIMLYEMLTGRHPWRRGSTVDTLHAILHDAPPEIDSTSPTGAEVAAVTRKLLRKDPVERYPTTEAVLEALASGTTAAGLPAAQGAVANTLSSIAVLPFFFLSEVEHAKALSLGFADALITMLANLEDVAVAPTSKILNYAAGSDPGSVCRDLGVRHVLQGRVQKLAARWRVSLQLFDAVIQKIAYSENHDFMLENVFDLQDEVGRRVIEALNSRFVPAVRKSRDRYSSDPEAYNTFIRGLGESFSKDAEMLRVAVERLSEAIERDPEFALAHATLAHVAMILDFEFEPRRGWLEKAEDHCERALVLDPGLPEGHLAKAWILWSPAKNFQHAEAIAELEQVLAAQPNLERAHNRMSTICWHIGHLEEARIAHERAQRLKSKTETGNLWNFYLLSGDFARLEVEATCLRERHMTKYDLHGYTLAPLYTGDLDLAEERLSFALKELPGEPLIVSCHGMLHARRKRTDLALQCARQASDSQFSFGHTHHTYYQIACIHGALGDTDKTMAWLERAAANGYPCWPFFRIDPYLECLRDLPAFKGLTADLERKYRGLRIQRL
jgi:TolB-like protein/predicted Ser/Thr protein kinase